MAVREKSIPLREWMESEAKLAAATQDGGKVLINSMKHKHQMIIRKVTVAYGISEILRHLSDIHQGVGAAATAVGDAASTVATTVISSSLSRETINCSIDNFSVRVSEKERKVAANIIQGGNAMTTRVNIEGVDILSPEISLKITEPSFLSDMYQDQMGRYLEVEILNKLLPTSVASSSGAEAAVAHENFDESSATLYSFGRLLYELFSHIDTSQVEAFVKEGKANQNSSNRGGNDMICQEPTRKKRASAYKAITEQGEAASPSPPTASQYMPLQELGFPSSLSLLVQNLLECRSQAKDAYDNLQSSSSDLHLLLLEPDRFLFDWECTPGNNGKIPLQIRKEKLYGRETEVAQIQEAFCRVSSGQSEAFFIGGFSGSGKTRLVESVRAQVDIAGGYVVIRKFDAMSKERPLLEIVAAFNDLCLIIKERNSSQHLDDTAANLLEAFGSDISVLVRLLPNLSVISPRLKKSASYNYSDGDQMNIQSVGFVLRRFVRVVSSTSTPLMLFLDDLQWCDYSALTVIEGILADKEGGNGGGSCLFFVGSYRSNEVKGDHSIYRFMDNLDRRNVLSTKLSLFGVNYNDLNTMISDAMGLFPRLCSNLSDIVFQKTKGNPFFVLEFLRSLVDGNLLEYSVRKRRWIWDEQAITAMDITDNVLSLLTNKMSQLSERVQSTLKVVSCFGFGIHESVIDLLSATTQYSNIREGLDELIWDSFMVAVAGDSTPLSTSEISSGRTWKFVHDKVREAAYCLIAEEDKDQYHEDLGLVLHSVSKGKKLGDAIFPIVDQINRGLQSVLQTPAMCIASAELNLEAGVKCCEQSDFSTANAYLTKALSLLPSEAWASHYNLSLQLHFLSAKSAYSCGNSEKACEAVRVILKEGSCIEDKVDAYFLLVNIFQAREEAENAYLTCLEVLADLGEKDFLNDRLPDYCDGKDLASMVAEITKNLECKTEEEMMAIKVDGALQISSIMKFYSFMTIVAFFVKPDVVLPICCRMVELTLAHGMTKHSVMGLIQYSVALCQGSSCKTEITSHAQAPFAIAKLAISLLNRIESSDIIARAYFIYYGHIAHFSEPIQSCGKWLSKGFEAGLSNGDTFSAFFCANHHIRLSLIGGGNLSTLLRESKYYLSVVEQHGNIVAKKFFLMYEQTIRVLIDKGASNQNDDGANELCQGDSVSHKRMAETMNFHKALQSFWLGYAERCHHYVLKLLQLNVIGRHHRLIILFYHGISSFTMLKRQRTSKLKQIPKEAIIALRAAAKDSRWNYRNKVHLLEAELSSHEGRNEDANSLYAAAIIASRSSRFIHEQGLACELAGFHYKKIEDFQRAWGFFNQAKSCYAEWGSEMKVEGITRQLAILTGGTL